MRAVLAIAFALVLTVVGSAAGGGGIFDPMPLEVPNPDASPGYVHLSSRPTEPAAELAAAQLTQAWGKWFEGHPALIRKVDLGPKGAHFQVLLKTRTMGDAARTCTNIRVAGGDCYVGPL